jgi:dipeptidyl aminopeptidase/acylaminoacyl peptidase
MAWYNIQDSSWNVFSMETGEHQRIASGLGIKFYNELDDTPNEAYPYGLAGWTADEKFIVYDRYDLWLLDPENFGEAVCLTGENGRKTKNRYRYLKLDKEERVLPEMMLLSAFNEVDKKSGYFTLNTKNGKLKEGLYSEHYYGRPEKAKEADQLIWTRESFTEFPDLYSSDLTFRNPIRVTDANPQQKEYNWGTTELVEWVTFNGDSLQGILVKPENFDPGKKYPMLVYFYERSTRRLNRYYPPKPIRSTVNWTYYASNGYLLFIPDIIYKKGYPGPSAYDCIVSGTMAMCERYDFIDRKNLGIQGQSWGGYQTAYIITQTNLYKAAMAGAPVSNMTSAYGGIRWGSGLSRAFQYEETQSRIGATLWEARDLYILNSPLFFVDRIETPLLMMHNDDDGAVPWYQGIEMFNAMRRLQKPVWMLVYNKAPHNLKRRADMEDLTIRMQQFFDHYLKGAPEPKWMSEGVPALMKGRELGLEVD